MNENRLQNIRKKHKIIASLTSFPFRIKTIHIVMERIFSQTLLADEVHLYLAKEQFPNKENDLTNELLQFCKVGLKIIWVNEDIKPHKKYYYVMQNFPDDIVITLDDDLIYDLDVFEKLYKSYLRFPNCVSAMRAREITFDKDNNLNPYSGWNNIYKNLINIPSMRLLAIGVGGTLYPPKCMHKELFNMDNIFNLCCYADDLWLKIMQIMNCTPTVLVQENKPLIYVDGSQEVALHTQNMYSGENDRQLKNILHSYNQYLGEDDTLINRILEFDDISNKTKSNERREISYININNTENKKISVIVPVYNVEEYLKRCLESLVNQTYRNLEIILIDDGSTDSSGEICDEYAKNDKRIKVIHQENFGASVARNVGLDVCTGEFVSFVDSDDYIYFDMYKICINIAIKEDTDYVEFEYKKVNSYENFDEIQNINYELHDSRQVVEGRVNWRKHYIYPWNKLFLAKFICQFRFIEGIICEDEFLFNKYSFKVNKVAYLPLKFYHYFIRYGSVMHTKFSMKHTIGLDSRIDLYNLIRINFKDLADMQLKAVFHHFYLDFKKVTDQKSDKDNLIRLKLIEILLKLSYELSTSSCIPFYQKQDLVLANKNPNKLIIKHEKGIVKK